MYEGDEENEKQILSWLTDEETLKIIGIIDEVNIAMLENILDDEDDAFVFFYDEDDPNAHTILEELERIDEKLDKQDLAMVKISDEGAIDRFGIEDLPALVYFENGVPELYEGDLLNDGKIFKWMKSELQQEEIKEITVKMLDKLVSRGKTMAVLFYDPTDQEDGFAMDEMERIDDECRRFGIDFVKVRDADKALEYGIDTFFGLLYFENKIPSLYDGDLNEEVTLLNWLIEQKMSDTIEEVTDEILKMLIEDEEYLGVYFSGPCDDPEETCAQILEGLESVDSKMQDYGVMLVTTEERELGKQHDIRSFPALGLFRNRDFVQYDGDLEDEMAILEWITDKETLLIPGKIDEVNLELLEKLVETETDILVFLYKEGNLNDEVIADNLQKIDDDLEEKGIELVKCSDKVAGAELGFGFVPILVFYHEQVPNIYRGDFDDSEEEILMWIKNTMERSQIVEVSGPVLDSLIERLESLAVIFFEDNDDEDGEKSSDGNENEQADDDAFLKLMENLDDDAEEFDIAIVKVSDIEKALEFGLDELPALLYFKNEVPGIYVGDMESSNEILEWLVSRVKENKIQLVSDQILENIVDKFPYIACFFTGCVSNLCGDDVQEMLSELETINDDIEDEAGILMVMNDEKRMAKRTYKVSKFPAIGLFKNGGDPENFALYEGDLSDIARILNWLSDVDTIEIPGKIEHVNEDMLKNIIESEDDVLVFFYDDDNDPDNVEEILTVLENLDDELSNEDVEVIRCSDENIIDNFGLTMLPSLVYFENGVPSIYKSGDLKNGDRVLGWITKELQSTAILNVDDKILDSALKRLEYVAVLFYDNEEEDDVKIVNAFDEITDECKQNDIRLVKTDDKDLLIETGLEDESPILVYYENNVPFVHNQHPLNKDDIEEALNWMIEQRNTAAIEEVTDNLLREVIEEHEYVAVLFSGMCGPLEEDEEDCNQVIDGLEKIDTNLDEHGIVFVKTLVGQMDVAKENWISKFPAIGYFRNGEYLKFKGDVHNERAVLKWLTSPKATELPNQIEEVNGLMLSKMLNRKDSNVFVFFYDDEDVFSRKVLRLLEKSDDELEAANVNLVKISDEDIEEEYDECDNLPCFAHFRRKPTIRSVLRRFWRQGGIYTMD